MHAFVAVARAALLAVVGAAVGFAAVAVHELTPGLLLGLAATGAAAYALPGGWTWRLPFAAGWCAVVLVTSQPRGAGSYLVASNARGYTLVVGAFALLLFSVVTAVRRPSRPTAEHEARRVVS
jgi:hypothetical protein